MGGIGSGNALYEARRSRTTAYPSLDIRVLAKHDLLRSGASFSIEVSVAGTPAVEVMALYTDGYLNLMPKYQFGYTGSRLDFENLRVVWSPCNYGGRRPWFTCPQAGCGRRVVILYWRDGFGCRRCHGLAYESQRESQVDRMARRIQKVQHRLEGCDSGGSLTRKPKGMHWSTYNRLCKEAEHIEQIVADALCSG
jgi:hypothetical protein